jgi:hypothetical protein
MGLFGDDKRQDERLDALEQHIRVLTETVQQNQLDIAGCRIGILAIEAQIEVAAEAIQKRLDEKISADEVDPIVQELNTKLGQARQRLEESSQAAEETWSTLQRGMRESFKKLRSSVDEAAESAKRI